MVSTPVQQEAFYKYFQMKDLKHFFSINYNKGVEDHNSIITPKFLTILKNIKQIDDFKIAILWRVSLSRNPEFVALYYGLSKYVGIGFFDPI